MGVEVGVTELCEQRKEKTKKLAIKHSKEEKNERGGTNLLEGPFFILCARRPTSRKVDMSTTNTACSMRACFFFFFGSALVCCGHRYCSHHLRVRPSSSFGVCAGKRKRKIGGQQVQPHRPFEQEKEGYHLNLSSFVLLLSSQVGSNGAQRRPTPSPHASLLLHST